MVLLALGGAGFYGLKRYFSDYLPPSKNIKQYLPLAGTNLSPIKITTGYRLDIFADLDGKRPKILAFDERDNLFVSLTLSGKIMALTDENNDLIPDRTVEILTGLDKPHGILFNQGYLYVAEASTVSRYIYNPNDLILSERKVLVSFPKTQRSSTRTIRIYNNKLYISDPPKSVIYIANLDGTDLNIVETYRKDAVSFSVNKNSGIIWNPDSVLGSTFDFDDNLIGSVGDKIVKFRMFAGGISGTEVVISGFVKDNGEVLGRPYDLAVDSNGNLFITDDKSGLIYVLYK